ncbi:DUF2066 domain-containing protein [Pseudomonadales bacterium]|nr:DUF2066 domain-containing protein [Pseudomonadales bacterium]
MLLYLQMLQSFTINSLRAVVVYLLCSQLAQASEAIDLFTTTIDVESESRQERVTASRTALKMLLIRVTGDKSALENYPLLAASVTNADRYIASFSYQIFKFDPLTDNSLSDNSLSNSSLSDNSLSDSSLSDNLAPLDLLLNDSPDSDSSDVLDNVLDYVAINPYVSSDNNTALTEAVIPEVQDVLRLNVVFQADAIKALLNQVGAPFWQANRPGVLVWLVEQSGGQQRIINAELAPQFYNALNQAAEARGVPLIQPLLDLEELNQIGAADLWDLSIPVIDSASQRYDNGAVLVGKFSQAYDKSWFGQWMLLYRGDRQIEHYRDTELADFFIQGSDLVADRLAADYAVAVNQTQRNNNLTIKFSGIRDHTDYLALSEYLRQVPALKAIQLSHIDGKHCYFSLEGSDDIDQVRALIELNDRLVPSRDDSRDSYLSNQLHYQWLDRS